ncbi:hypothetical protein HanRHA438_Chr02g0057201 [Helianthus annuus]|nr:hypothetical protein HanRHA438_Chr02g0057201 [Helianthus annuus]
MRGVGRFDDFRPLPPLRTPNDLRLLNIDKFVHSLLLFLLPLQLKGSLLLLSLFSLLLLSLLSLLFLSILPVLLFNLLFPFLSFFLLILLSFLLFLFLLLTTFLSFPLRVNSLRHVLFSNILLFSRLTTSSLRRLDRNFQPLRLWLSKRDTLLRGLLLDLCGK